jgi:hypothetical protein
MFRGQHPFFLSLSLPLYRNLQNVLTIYPITFNIQYKHIKRISIIPTGITGGVESELYLYEYLDFLSMFILTRLP